jgi:glucokinase
VNARQAIGIDVGGTKIAAGLVSLADGTIVEKRVVPTRLENRGTAALEDAVQLARELSRERPVDRIGLGICELVNRAGEIVSSNCLGWSTPEVRQRFAAIAPIVIEADVRAAALAEARFGAGRGLGNFLYVSVGTGISCSLVIGGVPFTGARGATGTFASGPMPGFSESLEDIASGPAIARCFKRNSSTPEVFLAAEAGEVDAIAVVRGAAEALGGALGWLVNTLDPEWLILGGSLGLREGMYRDLLQAAMRRHIWWPGHREIPLVSAGLGSDAGLIGAALAASSLPGAPV